MGGLRRGRWRGGEVREGAVGSFGGHLPDSFASEPCSRPEALIRTRWSEVLTYRSRAALALSFVSMGRDNVLQSQVNNG